uniref:Uncharacterized protein n=1 Tax=Anguilla anguilla TaxID=7936 RepID=A0A0E9WY29_ANGAN
MSWLLNYYFSMESTIRFLLICPCCLVIQYTYNSLYLKNRLFTFNNSPLHITDYGLMICR